MKELKQQVIIRKYQFEELTDSDKRLIEAAKEATKRSYAPYSHFNVGAAAYSDRLKPGECRLPFRTLRGTHHPVSCRF